jgi:hypothetical protein
MFYRQSERLEGLGRRSACVEPTAGLAPRSLIQTRIKIGIHISYLNNLEPLVWMPPPF